MLVGGSCGENSRSLPDTTAPDQRVGLPSVPGTVPASSAVVRRLVLVHDVDVGELSAHASDRSPSFAGESDTESVAGGSEPDLEAEGRGAHNSGGSDGAKAVRFLG